MPVENNIPLQTDTLSTVPGGGIRTVTAYQLVNGTLVPVQMQVVVMADGDGRIIDSQAQAQWQEEMLSQLREIRRLIALFMGVYQVIPETVGNLTNNTR